MLISYLPARCRDGVSPLIEFIPPVNSTQVSHGLNLVLRLRNALEMPLLLAHIAEHKGQVDQALGELNFVHFARFLPTRDGSALQVITDFDGPLQPYAMDFAIAIGDVFSLILGYVEDKPPLPVAEHPDEFWEFVQRNNRVRILGLPLPDWVDYPLYSAYPQKTVLDIIGPRTQLPPPVSDRPAAAIDRADVQGNLLDGYRPHLARHYILQVLDATRARRWFAGLATRGGEGGLALTTAERWDVKPATTLNLGFTHAGLIALGVDDDLLAPFPAAFREGPAQVDRATKNGDVGASAPENWRFGIRSQEHAMLSLYAFLGQDAAFDSAHAAVRGALAAAGLGLLATWDATALLDHEGKLSNRVHFGYVDGIAQPRIAGIDTTVDDLQPAASPGEFLLGPAYKDIYGGPSIGKLSPTLATNGTFCAVRLLVQDVDGFEALLTRAAADTGMDREHVAAKLMGRWRGGQPTALYPDQAPSGDSAPTNAFDYAPSYEYPDTTPDHAGLRCPIGAHARRANPRTSRVAGVRYSRRLIRRGMPYTLAATAERPAEKGMFGMFLCGSLERQFEFIQQQWLNGDRFTGGIGGTQDPICGAQTLRREFVIPGVGGKEVRLEIPRLITTRGSLYLFVPGLAAVRSLARLRADPDPLTVIASSLGHLRTHLSATLTPSAVAGFVGSLFRPKPQAVAPRVDIPPFPGGFDPAAFDPNDRGFLANPYPTFAQFREHRPVHFVPKHNAYWVFSHALVWSLLTDNTRFLKLAPGSTEPRGLFTMDPPRHTTVRALMNSAFAEAIAHASTTAAEVSARALADIREPRFDFVSAFARRVPLEVFAAIAGVPDSRRARVDQLARSVMQHADHTLDGVQHLIGQAAAVELVAELTAMLPGALLKPGTLLNAVARLIAGAQLSPLEGLTTLLLLCTGVRNLLLDNRRAWREVQDGTLEPLLAIDEMRRFEAPLGVIDRYAASQLSFGGLDIPRGARLMGMLGSANHDPAVFGDAAERFDPHAPARPNLALGDGMHRCIGEPLQARVMPIALQALMTRFPALALASAAQPPWSPDPYFRTFSSLTVDAGPRSA